MFHMKNHYMPMVPVIGRFFFQESQSMAKLESHVINNLRPPGDLFTILGTN